MGWGILPSLLLSFSLSSSPFSNSFPLRQTLSASPAAATAAVAKRPRRWRPWPRCGHGGGRSRSSAYSIFPKASERNGADATCVGTNGGGREGKKRKQGRPQPPRPRPQLDTTTRVDFDDSRRGAVLLTRRIHRRRGLSVVSPHVHLLSL